MAGVGTAIVASGKFLITKFLAATLATKLAIVATAASAAALIGVISGMPEIPNPDSATYDGDQPLTTVKEGTQIARAYGFTQLAGNVIRNSDPQEDTLKMIVAHCTGEIDSVLSWKLNNQEISRMEGTQIVNFESGSTTQTPTALFTIKRGTNDYVGDSQLIDTSASNPNTTDNTFIEIPTTFGTIVVNVDTGETSITTGAGTLKGVIQLDVDIFPGTGAHYEVNNDYFHFKPMAYRGIAYSSFYLEKDNQITSIPSVLSIGRWLKCTPIAQNIRRPAYKWTSGASGTNEYYCELSGGGDPSLLQPVLLRQGISGSTQGALGSLAVGEWNYGNNQIGYNTVYVRLADGSDPDTQSNGHVKFESANVFSRNPAVINWDFYRNVEKKEIDNLAELDFKSLETLCNVYPTTSDGAPLRPPGPGSTTVKATSFWGKGYEPAYCCDIESSIDGPSTDNAWVSAGGYPTNQRLNVDLGIPGILTKIVLINHFTSEADQLAGGIKNFAIEGSNDSSDFLNTTFGGGSWSGVSAGGVATQYDPVAPEQTHRVVTPSATAYRYYSLKITDNHGFGPHMGIRDVTFWIRNQRYTFDYNFDNKVSINDAKKLIWKSYNGTVISSQGKLKPVWDWNTVADGEGDLTSKTTQHAFTMDNIVKDSFSWSQIDAPNILTIHHLDSHENFKKTSITVRNDADIDERGEIPWDETSLYITSTDVAQRRAQTKLNKARYVDYRCSLSGFSDSQHLEVLDLVTISHPLPGWTDKKFVILEKKEDQYGSTSFMLEAYHAGMFGDQVAPIDESFRSWLPTPFGKPMQVTDLTLTDVSYFEAGGTYHVSIKVEYTKPRNATYWKGAMIEVDFGDAWASDNILGETTKWANHVEGASWQSEYSEYSEDRSVVIDGVAAGIRVGDTFRVRVRSVNEKGSIAEKDSSPTKRFKVQNPNLKAHIDRMPEAGGRMILPEGKYPLPSGGLIMPNKDIDIEGINKDLVVIKNTAGSDGFVLANLTKTFKFSNFKMDSQNVAAYTNMISITGDTTEQNTTDVAIQEVNLTLQDNGTWGGDGDIGIFGDKGFSTGSLTIKDCITIGGKNGISIDTYAGKVSISDNTIKEAVSVGILVDTSIKPSIVNNIIVDSMLVGIDVISCIKPSVIGNKVTSIDDDADSGFVAANGIGGFLSDDAVISSNIITMINSRGNINAKGIAFRGDRYQISANVINIDISSVNGGVGMDIDVSDDCVITGNKITIDNDNNTNTHYGIFYSTGDRNTITSNSIDMVNSDSVRDVGINIGGDNNQITGNNFYRFGVRISNSGSGNIIGSNTEAGINMAKGDGEFAKQWMKIMV